MSTVAPTLRIDMTEMLVSPKLARAGEGTSYNPAPFCGMGDDDRARADCPTSSAGLLPHMMNLPWFCQ